MARKTPCEGGPNEPKKVKYVDHTIMSTTSQFPNPQEKSGFRVWKETQPPKRILVIRIQAFGDLFATFPIICSLKERFPQTEIDLLVREDYAELPEAFSMFTRVIRLKGGTSSIKKSVFLGLALPGLWFRNYDIVLDLQRNRSSRMLRRLLFPKAWSEFDRFGPTSVLLRNQVSVEQLGFSPLPPRFSFVSTFSQVPLIEEKLRAAGWDGSSKLVLVNPAGYCETRSWPLAHYQNWMADWLENHPETQFLFLGLPTIADKVKQLETVDQSRMVNLVGQTSLLEMFTLLTRTHLVLTEDSGLGHIAWLSGLKTVMLLGSTRSDWANPIGEHTICFNSDHLSCGNCMAFACPLQTVACMRDLLPSVVLEATLTLFSKPTTASF